jgi:thymidylate kinase
MKILIIEGIPTSGKSSIIKKITELLGEGQVRVYGESETHIPIMDEPEKLHIEFFESLIQEAATSDASVVIFDRFHLTQAIRAKASIGAYSKIENLLTKQKTLVVYLQINDSEIADRLRFAAEHREKEQGDDFRWDKYFKRKGKTYDEIAKHYAAQQRDKAELLKQSKLKSRIFDTTNQEYQAISNQIIKEWLNQK